MAVSLQQTTGICVGYDGYEDQNVGVNEYVTVTFTLENYSN